MSNELIDLPESWALVSLAEITHRITKGTTPTSLGFDFSNEGILFVKVESISEQRINHVLCAFIDADADEALARSRLQENDILFSIAGTLGRVAIVHKDDLPANTNQALAIIRLIKPIFPDYIAQALSSHLLEKTIHESGRGVGLQNINLKQVSEFQVPLPPLNEQKRIIAKIEELHDRHQRAKQALEAVPQLCDRFRQSVLAAAFRGDLTADWRAENPNPDFISDCLSSIDQLNKEKKARERERAARIKGEQWFFSLKDELPQEWLEVNFMDVTWLITCGVAKKPDYVEDGIPFLSAQNSKPFKANLNDIRFISKEDFKKFTVGGKPEKDDILYSRVGAKFGEASKISFDFDFAIYVSLTLIKPIHTLIDSDFLVAFLNSPYGVIQAHGGILGSGIQNLNVENVRHYRIPLPSLAEQKEIVRRIKSSFSAVDSVEQQYQEISSFLARLNESILSKAFRGELVEQDPNDEPAAVLLERIRAEREQGSKKTGGGKGKRKQVG